MKVFFLASARIEDINLAKCIYDLLEELGCKHTSNFMIKFDQKHFYEASEKEWGERYRSRLKEIAQADICVCEVSMHSLAMGQLVQEAIRREKPVIILYQLGKKPQFMIGTAVEEKRVQLLEYSMDDLKEVLEYGLEQAKEMLTVRFTMLMPPEYDKILNKINEEEGISRSDYIRGLIKEDVKKREK